MSHLKLVSSEGFTIEPPFTFSAGVESFRGKGTTYAFSVEKPSSIWDVGNISIENPTVDVDRRTFTPYQVNAEQKRIIYQGKGSANAVFAGEYYHNFATFQFDAPTESGLSIVRGKTILPTSVGLYLESVISKVRRRLRYEKMLPKAGAYGEDLKSAAAIFESIEDEMGTNGQDLAEILTDNKLLREMRSEIFELIKKACPSVDDLIASISLYQDGFAEARKSKEAKVDKKG